MRMAELSGRSGVPIPTIKFYLREGLLAPGVRTSPNQADYADTHVRRLALIRALLDVGGLSVATTRTVLDRLDDPDADPDVSLGKVQYSLTSPATADADALARVDDLIRRLGWQVRAANPARISLADALTALGRLGRDDVLAALDRYADAVHAVADVDVALVVGRPTPDDQAETMVVAMVLGDALLAALRRLAQEDVFNRRA